MKKIEKQVKKLSSQNEEKEVIKKEESKVNKKEKNEKRVFLKPKSIAPLF